jgi:hypothetical protein
MRFKTTNVEVNQQLRKRKAAWWQYPPLESVVLGENLDKSRGKKNTINVDKTIIINCPPNLHK